MNQCKSPGEILEYTAEKGVEKAESSFKKLAVLSFLAGMYVALGYLSCLKITVAMPKELAGLGAFLGACVFPVGLIAVLLAGGELITGNMLVLSVSFLRRQISAKGLARNWAIVTLGNMVGAMATAWFLFHMSGMAQGALLEKVLATAADKVDASFLQAFFSGVGCNIFVSLGVWLSYSAKDAAGKVLTAVFPVTAFVAIGFQHVVANMFVIPAALFSGQSALTWLDFAGNCLPVWLGNMAGGALVLGLLYCVAYTPAAARKDARNYAREGVHELSENRN